MLEIDYFAHHRIAHLRVSPRDGLEIACGRAGPVPDGDGDFVDEIVIGLQHEVSACGEFLSQRLGELLAYA